MESDVGNGNYSQKYLALEVGKNNKLTWYYKQGAQIIMEANNERNLEVVKQDTMSLNKLINSIFRTIRKGIAICTPPPPRL